MTTIVARVLRVLIGHSPTAMLHAHDNDGHELRLEVPAESVRSVSPGQVLVVQWSVHSLPELAAGEVVVETTPSQPGAAASAATSAPRMSASPQPDARSPEQELEAMLGLKPGRLQHM